ncbi:2-oxoacid:acceptor oxidoreductase subunit alpha [bacterium]|nr:MAG: 2-oxoacid:acceptor oxidoreductase subunit alpha [bacterium]
MSEFSFLIGGKAGDGIDKSGLIIARILSRLGYHIYIYRDYPSIIRGGHTFSIIRASPKNISTHLNQVDIIFALNQDTVDLHSHRLKDKKYIIYDSDAVKSEGTGVGLEKILKDEDAPVLMRNSCLVGAFVKSCGIDWLTLEEIFKKGFPKDVELNLKVARKGYDAVNETIKVPVISGKSLPVLLGNEAIGLGLVKAGLKNYVAYPMTPTSGVLHFLAGIANDFSLKVIHPESEIAVMLMALGFAYCGQKTAVGTSGGGFCLMTEGLSFAGMAELPVVVIVGQRPGPSTGLPTYTSQTELNFVMTAGQGEFTRLVVAPGDIQEAYYWAAVSLNLAWKYQIPVILLSDKTLSEGTYSFDLDSAGGVPEENGLFLDAKLPYKRYLNTESGISPLAFPGDKDVAVKVNSYEHDESGITAEEPEKTRLMQEKRLRKEKYLFNDLIKYNPVKVYGDTKSDVTLVCWGSNKGVCVEAAEKLGLKVVQPLVLLPFPCEEFRKSITGSKKIICLENNATGQLADILIGHGISVNERILRYDGRPFSLDELEVELKKLI